jgi:hypothetical protein
MCNKVPHKCIDNTNTAGTCSCPVTFVIPYTARPVCTVTPQFNTTTNGGAYWVKYNDDSSMMEVDFAETLSGAGDVNYLCIGRYEPNPAQLKNRSAK